MDIAQKGGTGKRRGVVYSTGGVGGYSETGPRQGGDPKEGHPGGSMQKKKKLPMNDRIWEKRRGDSIGNEARVFRVRFRRAAGREGTGGVTALGVGGNARKKQQKKRKIAQKHARIVQKNKGGGE